VRLRRRIGLVGLGVALTACAPSAADRARRLEGRYRLTAPTDGWRPVAPGGADHAWHHATSGATLYVDSNCGPRYDEQPASILATELVAGLQGAATDSEAPLPLAGRVGVLRTHHGTLDGVPVRLALAVLNRDACTYDFVLVAPPASFDAARAAHAALLASFGVP
jgi:hypothetical protein